MIGNDGTWKTLATVDLATPQADGTVQNALNLDGSLQTDVTLA